MLTVFQLYDLNQSDATKGHGCKQMDNLNADAIIMMTLLAVTFIPFIYLLIKMWIDQYKIQFGDDDE